MAIIKTKNLNVTERWGIYNKRDKALHSKICHSRSEARRVLALINEKDRSVSKVVKVEIKAFLK